MMKKRSTAANSIRIQLRRVLTCVLFAGIVYSLSFGTVHIHGDVVRAAQAFGLASTGDAGALINVSGTPDTTTDECLICTFHRQLSVSTVDSPHFFVTASPQIVAASSAITLNYSDPVASEPDTRISGRAPPAL